LVDKVPDKIQTKNIAHINNTFGKAINIEIIKTAMYDIVGVAKICVDLIDNLSKDASVYVNITSGRKTKSIAVLFAAYARHDMVKKIVYFTEENKGDIIYLPRFSFKLSKSQKMILELIDEGKFKSIKDLQVKSKLSTAMVYRAIDELRDNDFIDKKKLELTDAGKIARL